MVEYEPLPQSPETILEKGKELFCRQIFKEQLFCAAIADMPAAIIWAEPFFRPNECGIFVRTEKVFKGKGTMKHFLAHERYLPLLQKAGRPEDDEKIDANFLELMTSKGYDNQAIDEAIDIFLHSVEQLKDLLPARLIKIDRYSFFLTINASED